MFVYDPTIGTYFLNLVFNGLFMYFTCFSESLDITNLENKKIKTQSADNDDLP